MGFIKTDDEVTQFFQIDAKFYDAEIYLCFWQIDPIIYRKLIPHPLEPDEDCPIFAYFINFPKSAFGPYHECALFVGVQYKKRFGLYCLSMPLDNDMAMAGGREWLGFPKKYARININREGEVIYCSSERHGIEFVKITYDFHAPYKTPKALELQNRYFRNEHIIFFNFRNFVQSDAVDHIHLLQIKTQGKLYEMKQGNAQIELTPSKTDPWSDLKGSNPLGALYMKHTFELRPPNIFSEVDTKIHTPFTFIGWDF